MVPDSVFWAYVILSVLWTGVLGPIIVVAWFNKLGVGQRIEDRTVKRTKEEIEPYITRFEDALTEYEEKIDGKIKEISTDIESKIEAKIEDITVGIEGSIDEKIKEIDAIIDDKKNQFLKDFMDPMNQQSAELMGTIVGRAWVMFRENPDMQESFRKFIDRKIDYVVNHFIKRLADDPEFMKKMIDAWKQSQAAKGAGKLDIMGLLQGFMSGDMQI